MFIIIIYNIYHFLLAMYNAVGIKEKPYGGRCMWATVFWWFVVGTNRPCSSKSQCCRCFRKYPWYIEGIHIYISYESHLVYTLSSKLLLLYSMLLKINISLHKIKKKITPTKIHNRITKTIKMLRNICNQLKRIKVLTLNIIIGFKNHQIYHWEKSHSVSNFNSHTQNNQSKSEKARHK